jgi:ubiquinone/menaquinone biosynthesis C-methylase UbiE
MNKYRYYLIVLFLLLSHGLYAQESHHNNQGQANAHMNQQSFSDLANSFESGERDEWQKPDEVIATLGDLHGKSVMDIGSGTGYFSFRLLKAGAKVICADVDQRFLDHISKRKDEMHISDTEMELRKVPFDSSLLKPSEVDVVLIVDTYHHIENRIAYFSEVKTGLKPGGKLVVVDFKKEDSPVGPPKKMKMSAMTIVKELKEAGFTTVETNQDLLPHQYIINAY